MDWRLCSLNIIIIYLQFNDTHIYFSFDNIDLIVLLVHITFFLGVGIFWEVNTSAIVLKLSPLRNLS